MQYPHENYDAMVSATVERVLELGIKKGGEYAGDDDRLANFRRNAAAFGVSMELIWGVYAAKHWDAIAQYVNDTENKVGRDRMESLAGRADDLITYLILFKCILHERERAGQTTIGSR